jgi:hypothetical protein
MPSLGAAAADLDAAIRATGRVPVVLEPYTDDEVARIAEAVRPDVLSDEVFEFLRLRCPSPWERPRLPFDQVETELAAFRQLGAPHWLPLGGQERDHWFVVLGDDPSVRMPVGLWSSNALVVAAPFPSLRSLLAGCAVAQGERSVLAEDVLFVDWWQAVVPPRHADEACQALWERIGAPLRTLIDDEDESPTWPSEAPYGFEDFVRPDAWDERRRSMLRV